MLLSVMIIAGKIAPKLGKTLAEEDFVAVSAELGQVLLNETFRFLKIYLVRSNLKSFREVSHHFKEEELEEVPQDLILILLGERIEAKAVN